MGQGPTLKGQLWHVESVEAHSQTLTLKSLLSCFIGMGFVVHVWALCPELNSRNELVPATRKAVTRRSSFASLLACFGGQESSRTRSRPHLRLTILDDRWL